MYSINATRHGFNASSALNGLANTTLRGRNRTFLRALKSLQRRESHRNGIVDLYGVRKMSSNTTTSPTSGRTTDTKTTGFIEDVQNLWKTNLQIPKSPNRDGWTAGQEDIFLHVPKVHAFYRTAWLLRWVMVGVMTWTLVDTLRSTVPNPNFNPYNPGSEPPYLPVSTNKKIAAISVSVIGGAVVIGISLRLRRRLVTTMAFRVDRLHIQPPLQSSQSSSIAPTSTFKPSSSPSASKILDKSSTGTSNPFKKSSQPVDLLPQSQLAAGSRVAPMVVVYTLEGRPFAVPLTNCRLVDLKGPGNLGLEVDGHGKWVVEVEDAEITYKDSSKPVNSKNPALLKAAKSRKDANDTKDTKTVIPPFKYVPEGSQNITKQREIRNEKAKNHLLWLWYWETQKYPITS